MRGLLQGSVALLLLVGCIASLGIVVVEATNKQWDPCFTGDASDLALKGQSGYSYQPFSEPYSFTAYWHFYLNNTDKGHVLSRNELWVEITVAHTIPTGNWIGIGPYSRGQKMDGLLILCVPVLSPAGTSYTTTCQDYQGDDYDIDPWEEEKGYNIPSVVVSSNQTNGVNYFTIRRRLTLPYYTSDKRNENGFGIDMQKDNTADACLQRTIWAYGPMKYKKNGQKWDPKQHEGYAIRGAALNWVSGDLQVEPSQRKYVAYFFTILITCVIFIINQGLWRLKSFAIGDSPRWALTFLLSLLYFALFVWYAVAAWRDYYDVARIGPFIRSLGDAAGFLLGGMLLTVSRRYFFSAVFGVSHERATKFHAVLGFLFIVCLAWHVIGMANMYGASFLFRWKPTSSDEISVLPGLLAGVLFVVMFLFAIQRFELSYAAFRYTHYLWPIAIIFACLHYRKLIYLLLPGLIAIVLNLLSGRMANWSAKIQSIKYDPKAKLTLVTISREVTAQCCRSDNTVGLEPAQWFYLGFPAISWFQFHPFSVYHCEETVVRGDRVQLLSFAIKDTEGRGGNGSLLRPLFLKLLLLIKQKDRWVSWRERQSWTTKLAGSIGLTVAESSSSSNMSPGHSPTSPGPRGGGGYGATSPVSSPMETRGEGNGVAGLDASPGQSLLGGGGAAGNLSPGGGGRRRPGATGSAVHESVVLEGPFGSLQLPLHKYEHVLLVSGGIGVTPNLFTLQHIASGRYPNIRRVRFTWVMPDAALLPHFAAHLLQYNEQCQRCGIVLQLALYVTASKGGELPTEIESLRDHLGLTTGQRPEFGSEFDQLGGHMGEDGDTTINTRGSGSGFSHGATVAVYACGPTKLIASCKQAVRIARMSKSRVVHFHEEVFDV